MYKAKQMWWSVSVATKFCIIKAEILLFSVSIVISIFLAKNTLETRPNIQ